jgi:hypothetical protein
MPIIIAAIVGLGSFFGYVGIQSGNADRALHNIERSLDYTPVVLDLQCRNLALENTSGTMYEYVREIK